MKNDNFVMKYIYLLDQIIVKVYKDISFFYVKTKKQKKEKHVIYYPENFLDNNKIKLEENVYRNNMNYHRE